MHMPKLIDLTQTVTDETLPYPGDDHPKLLQVRSLLEDGYCNFRLEICTHTGTHIDGAMHLTESGMHISELPLDRCMGKGCLLDARDINKGNGPHTYNGLHSDNGSYSGNYLHSDNSSHASNGFSAVNNIISLKESYLEKVCENDIVLFYTGHDELYGTPEYFEHHPVIDLKLAEFLVQMKIKALGIDFPSPDRHPFEVHKLLLENGIPIIENLTNLGLLLSENEFEIMAFPLKIKADSSVLRVVARV